MGETSQGRQLAWSSKSGLNGFNYLFLLFLLITNDGSEAYIRFFDIYFFFISVCFVSCVPSPLLQHNHSRQPACQEGRCRKWHFKTHSINSIEESGGRITTVYRAPQTATWRMEDREFWELKIGRTFETNSQHKHIFHSGQTLWQAHTPL